MIFVFVILSNLEELFFLFYPKGLLSSLNFVFFISKEGKNFDVESVEFHTMHYTVYYIYKMPCSVSTQLILFTN